MGLALADGGAKLAIGTTLQVWEFRDNRDVARRPVTATFPTRLTVRPT
jgi:hypothetical protein